MLGAEPHAALGWLLWRHPGRFPGAALRLALTFDSTLIGYFATPTAPPWWASEIEGRMDSQVRRVNAEVMRAVRGERRPGAPHDHILGSNPWAAWPSDHFASAMTAAIALAQADRRAGVLGFGYAAALGFALVYTGEHYVTDLLLGAGLALLISWRRISPLRRQSGSRKDDRHRYERHGALPAHPGAQLARRRAPRNALCVHRAQQRTLSVAVARQASCCARHAGHLAALDQTHGESGGTRDAVEVAVLGAVAGRVVLGGRLVPSPSTK